ncbi:hypothetical protein TNCV_3445771 [Trichonephila clavipes]|nr:hypothetical protein TNCV_3445771 [Trichonephila clavipes]
MRHTISSYSKSRPSGIVVSEASCCVVGPGPKSSREDGGQRREMGDPDRLQSVLSQNWSGTEPKRTVTSMVIKVMANDRRI